MLINVIFGLSVLVVLYIVVQSNRDQRNYILEMRQFMAEAYLRRPETPEEKQARLAREAEHDRQTRRKLLREAVLILGFLVGVPALILTVRWWFAI